MMSPRIRPPMIGSVRRKPVAERARHHGGHGRAGAGHGDGQRHRKGDEMGEVHGDWLSPKSSRRGRGDPAVGDGEVLRPLAERGEDGRVGAGHEGLAAEVVEDGEQRPRAAPRRDGRRSRRAAPAASRRKAAPPAAPGRARGRSAAPSARRSSRFRRPPAWAHGGRGGRRGAGRRACVRRRRRAAVSPARSAA